MRGQNAPSCLYIFTQKDLQDKFARSFLTFFQKKLWLFFYFFGIIRAKIHLGRHGEHREYKHPMEIDSLFWNMHMIMSLYQFFQGNPNIDVSRSKWSPSQGEQWEGQPQGPGQGTRNSELFQLEILKGTTDRGGADLPALYDKLYSCFKSIYLGMTHSIYVKFHKESKRLRVKINLKDLESS